MLQEEVLCGWCRVWRQNTTEVWVRWVQAVTRLLGETQATSTSSEQGDPEHCTHVSVLVLQTIHRFHNLRHYA